MTDTTTKAMQMLQQMELTEENRAKLSTLVAESKKTGKVASKVLVQTLDAVDATEEQTETFYDVLEAAGIETGLDTVLVLSGVTDKSDIKKFPYRPRLVLNGVGDIPPAAAENA